MRAGEEGHEGGGKQRGGGSLYEAGDVEGGEGRLLRGLEHDRAPGRQGRAQLPREHQQGEVPRQDLEEGVGGRRRSFGGQGAKDKERASIPAGERKSGRRKQKIACSAGGRTCPTAPTGSRTE